MEHPTPADFPQHARVAIFIEDRNMLHAFLHKSGYELCAWNESENAYVLTTKDHETILDEFFEIDRAALVQEQRVLRGVMMDLLAREAADDMFEQLNLQVQEENDATPEAVEDMFKQLDLLIEKEEDDDGEEALNNE